MNTRTVYICEFCHSEYKTSKEAYECEAKCLGLTVEQYKEYVNLLQEEKRAFGVAGCYMNDEVRKRCDDVVKAVLDFQKEHNFTDNRLEENRMKVNGLYVSEWDGWNSDYPNIKNICFLVADMEMIDRAKQFLMDTETFHDWNMFESNQFSKWIGKDWLHSDRWSAAYDWVNDGRFENIEIPNDIIECLVEYWETNALHIKVGV